MIKHFGLLPTLIVYLNLIIYQISFLKVRTTKINREFAKLLCVS